MNMNYDSRNHTFRSNSKATEQKIKEFLFEVNCCRKQFGSFVFVPDIEHSKEKYLLYWEAVRKIHKLRDEIITSALANEEDNTPRQIYKTNMLQCCRLIESQPRFENIEDILTGEYLFIFETTCFVVNQETFNRNEQNQYLVENIALKRIQERKTQFKKKIIDLFTKQYRRSSEEG